MNYIKPYLLLIIVAFTSVSGYAQQTIQFTQYTFNGLAINPAYAGYKDEWTVNLSYRNQWTGINGAPKTGTVSVDGLTNAIRKNTGFGIIAVSDKLGPQSTSALYLNYAYRIRLDADDSKRLSFGMAVGAEQFNLDASKLIATDVSDGLIPAGNQSKISPDLRFGLYFYTPKFYFGASIINVLSNLNNTSTSDYAVIKETRHIYLTGGMMIPLTESLDLKPSFMIKDDFKGPKNIDLNSYLLINKLVWIGASYRTAVPFLRKSNLEKNLERSDAFAALFQVYVNERLRLGYSFDYTTNQMADLKNGTHEISLSLSFRNRQTAMLTPRYF